LYWVYCGHSFNILKQIYQKIFVYECPQDSRKTIGTFCVWPPLMTLHLLLNDAVHNVSTRTSIYFKVCLYQYRNLLQDCVFQIILILKFLIKHILDFQLSWSAFFLDSLLYIFIYLLCSKFLIYLKWDWIAKNERKRKSQE
jgi:hypothetical protein